MEPAGLEGTPARVSTSSAALSESSSFETGTSDFLREDCQSDGTQQPLFHSQGDIVGEGRESWLLLPSGSKGSESKPQTTPIRWWVLFLFVFSGINSSITWNVFAPLGETIQLGLGWDPNGKFLFWLVNTANFATVIFGALTSSVVSTMGVRKLSIISVFVIFFSTALRLLPLAPLNYKIVNVIIMFLNGAGGAFQNMGGAVISEIWFPPEERVLATSIGSMGVFVGTALGFVVGIYYNVAAHNPNASVAEAKASLSSLFWMETVLCGVCLLLTVVYFPDKPNFAPSRAAFIRGSERGQSWRGEIVVRGSDKQRGSQSGPNDSKSRQHQRSPFSLQYLFGCGGHKTVIRKYWAIVVLYGLPLGLFQAWSSVLNAYLNDFLQAEQIGWIGFYMTVSGCLGSVAVGAIVDRFQGRLQLALTSLTALAAIAYLSFVLVVTGHIAQGASQELKHMLVYVTSISGGFLFNCGIPVAYEMVVESSYGVLDEGIASGGLGVFNNIVQCVLLIIAAQSESSQRIVTIGAPLTMAVATIGIPCFAMQYPRLLVDKPGFKISWFDKVGLG